MVYWIIKIILGPFIRFFWIKKVEGLENIPRKGPIIIAANHSSYFDFFSLIAICPRRIYFLAAEKFFKGKIWGPLVKTTGQIKVERKSSDKSKVYQSVENYLKKGKIIGIFPEGTRSWDGKIHKTFTGVANLALKNRTRVIPIGIKNAFEILPRQKKIPKLKKIIEIKIGEPMLFSDYYGQENDKRILREITDKIMLKITELLNN